LTPLLAAIRDAAIFLRHYFTLMLGAKRYAVYARSAIRAPRR
jgi:hypothetical protein